MYTKVGLLTHQDDMFGDRTDDDDESVGSFYSRGFYASDGELLVGSGPRFDVWWKVNAALISYLNNTENRMDVLLRTNYPNEESEIYKM